MCKKIFFTISVLVLSTQLFAQLDNTTFGWRNEIKAENESQLRLTFNSLAFAKNNEYSNGIADGFTLLGYQFNPSLEYTITPTVSLKAGLFLLKDFGTSDFSEVAPTFTLKIKRGKTTFIFGTLEGGSLHRYIEPLYDFENLLRDPLENGLQVRRESDRLFADFWLDWETFIERGDPHREIFSTGLSLDYTILKSENISVSIPFQLMVNHKGGQIDSSPKPVQSVFNSAIGLSLQKKIDNDNIFKGFALENYYVYHQDFSSDRSKGVFDDGEGWYVNASVNTKFGQLMTSYWRGNEFISIKGGQLYQSVSSTFKTPDQVEKFRELLFIRLMYEGEITEGLTLAGRIEPYFDLRNNLSEFSAGLYLTFQTDFFITKLKEHP